MKSVRVLAYMAGLVDGEGCIAAYMRKRKQTPEQRGYSQRIITLTITSTNMKILRFCTTNFGGKLYSKKRAKPNWKPCFDWRIRGMKVVVLLEQLLPYLTAKHDKAIRACRFKVEGA